MPLSVPDICNLALGDLGDKRITALDDATNQAKQCRNFYDQTRDVVLREHPWNFAIQQAELSEDATEPLVHFAHQFVLPDDFIRLTQLNGFEAWEPRDEFKINGRLLLTDADTATIEYVKRVEDSAQFDPLFIEALAKLLASKLAAPLTNDRNLGVILRREYKSLLTDAQQTDANEARPKVKMPWVESRFVNARYTGTIV